MERAKGFEPSTFSLGSCTDPHVTPANRRLTDADGSACTSACTSKPENGHESKVEVIAAMLRELPPEDRARLAAMLTAEANESHQRTRPNSLQLGQPTQLK